MHLRTWIYLFILSLVFPTAVQVMAGDIPHPDIPRISAEEAQKLLQSGKEVVFLDVRAPSSWQKSNEKIANAIRLERGVPLDQQLAGIDREQTIIAYCT